MPVAFAFAVIIIHVLLMSAGFETLSHGLEIAMFQVVTILAMCAAQWGFRS